MAKKWLEQFVLVGAVGPANLTDEQQTPNVDFSQYDRAVFVVLLGELEAASKVDFGLFASADGITDFSALPDKKMATRLEAEGAGDEQILIELQASELPADHYFVQGKLEVTGKSDAAVVILAENSRYRPGDPTPESSNVTEIVF